MSESLWFVRVSRRFGKDADAPAALDDLTLECRAGDVTCLAGPNGAGKSTALSLAAGLSLPSDGEIRFAGRPVGPDSPPEPMGYLPQRSAFPAELRVDEVLEFGLRARRTDGEAHRELLEITGLAGVLDDRVGALSSGWIRRLGLALALAPPARLLLLDEPFAGLDVAILDRVVEHLNRRASSGETILLASHDFDTIDRLEARIAVLDEGRLAAVGKGADGGSRAFYREVLVGSNERRDGDLKSGEPSDGEEARTHALAG